MVRKQSRTAAEFAAELARDSAYQERLRTQEARGAALAADVIRDEAALVQDLRATGATIDSVWDYVSRGSFEAAVEPTPAATALLVQHLQVKHHARVREGIIRALSRRAATAEAHDALLRAFGAAHQNDERWLLANALAAMVPFEAVAQVPEMERYRELFPRAPL